MIRLEQEGDCLYAEVHGEFTLSDVRELEAQVLAKDRPAKLALDLQHMLSYSVDVVWEEIQFVRNQESSLARVAVITDNQWLAWLAWLGNLSGGADFRCFAAPNEARAWIHA